jgi:hypothetical protein
MRNQMLECHPPITPESVLSLGKVDAPVLMTSSNLSLRRAETIYRTEFLLYSSKMSPG